MGLVPGARVSPYEVTGLGFGGAMGEPKPSLGRQAASFVVDDLLVRHVAKHQAQIRRNVSQFKPRSSE